MVLVLATLRAYPLFTHQIFVLLPDASLQYSRLPELHFHKTKCRHGFCQIWGRLDVLERYQPLHCQHTTNPRVHRQRTTNPPSVTIRDLRIHTSTSRDDIIPAR